MNIKQLVTDDDAVSPVIGVILMVAITVILAAVIGTFVLGLGDRVGDNAPQATWEFDWNNDGDDSGDDVYSDSDDLVTITHGGGQTVQSARLTISAGSGSISSFGSWGDEITAGDSNSFGDGSSGATNTFTGNVLASGNKIQIIWSPAGGGSSSIIGQSAVPA